MPGIQWVLNKCWLNKRINEWVMWSDDTSLQLWNPSHNIIRSRNFFFFKAVSAPVRLSIYINCFQATVSSLPSLLSSLTKELWSKHVSVHAGGVMVPDPQSWNHPPELFQEANGQKPHPTYLFTDCFRPEVLKVCDWSQLRASAETRWYVEKSQQFNDIQWFLCSLED